MADLLGPVLLATAAAEEYVPPNDWRGAIALPISILIFFGAIFLLLKSNLGTRRAYLVEATCFFGFMVVLSLFWGFGAPGTPMNVGPQTLPGRPPDYYLPKWNAFAPDSNLASDRFQLVQQFPEGFEEVQAEIEAGGGEAEGETTGAAVDPAAGAEEIGTFFSEERGGEAPIGSDWVLDQTYVTTTGDGVEVVGATFAKPFALDDNGEIPQGPDGQPLFGEDDVGTPIPEDFAVPSGADSAVVDLVTPESFTGFAFYDPGFALFPALIMMALSIAGFVLHALLLGWDENREKERVVDEVVVEREPVGATR